MSSSSKRSRCHVDDDLRDAIKEVGELSRSVPTAQIQIALLLRIARELERIGDQLEAWDDRGTCQVSGYVTAGKDGDS